MKRILLLMIAVITVFTISSCSKEVGEFVGIWQCDNHYYGGPDVYEFKEDGSYTWKCPGWTSESGIFSYTSATITFTQYFGRTKTYILLSKTNSNFVIMDEAGDSYTYFKK